LFGKGGLNKMSKVIAKIEKNKVEEIRVVVQEVYLNG
jgi:hypothetical protein